jgi:hypothetical protein
MTFMETIQKLHGILEIIVSDRDLIFIGDRTIFLFGYSIGSRILLPSSIQWEN